MTWFIFVPSCSWLATFSWFLREPSVSEENADSNTANEDGLSSSKKVPFSHGTSRTKTFPSPVSAAEIDRSDGDGGPDYELALQLRCRRGGAAEVVQRASRHTRVRKTLRVTALSKAMLNQYIMRGGP